MLFYVHAATKHCFCLFTYITLTLQSVLSLNLGPDQDAFHAHRPKDLRLGVSFPVGLKYTLVKFKSRRTVALFLLAYLGPEPSKVFEYDSLYSCA